MPSISPQADWLNQTQATTDGGHVEQSSGTAEAATSSRPVVGAATILVNTARNHLPLISFFVVMLIALLVGMLSDTQVHVPRQIAKD